MQKLQEINFLLGGKLVLVMEVGEGGREGGGWAKGCAGFLSKIGAF